MIRNFQEMLAKVANAPTKRVVVAGACKDPVIEAIKIASDRDLVKPILVGQSSIIRKMAESHDFDLHAVPIVDCDDDEQQICTLAVTEVREGRADLLMKGSVSTEKLLKAVLARETGLRSGRVLSHVAVVEAERYDKLMFHTDGGINLHQDLATRKDILTNAVELARCFEIDHPFIAGLALVEKENPKLPETLDMAELVRWASGGLLGNLFIEGPMGIDMAYSHDAAALKGIGSRVAGQTDIFMHPNITTANFVVKSLIQLDRALVAGVVVGARAPIVLLSRSDAPEIRVLSLALGTLYDEQEIESSKHRPYFG